MECDPPFETNSWTFITSSAPDASISYTKGLEYWNSISSDVNGMLGGFPQTSRIDLLGSSTFLAKLRRGKAGGKPAAKLPRLDRVADCGAGIGRITKGLLLDVATTVDVIEPVKKFTDTLVEEAREHGEEKGEIGDVVNLGLQDWTPEPGAYSLIWNQWCLGHLNDAQLVSYLRRCKDGLVVPTSTPETEDTPAQGGWIVVKENLSKIGENQDIYDAEDSSVTRSDDKFRRLFKEAGLKIVDTKLQTGFPKELYPVRMYALRPE